MRVGLKKFPVIYSAKKAINRCLRLTPDDELRQKWLAHVRAYPRYQSKPDPGPFDHSSLSHHLLRRIGKHSPWLRRRSGLFLPAPSQANPYKIWEKPAEAHNPNLPHSLLNQELDETFLYYHPSFSSRSSFILRIPNGSFQGHDHSLFDHDFKPIDWEPPYWAVNCGLPGTLFRKSLSRPLRLRGRALILSAPAGGGNIWHFLFDSLPKLKLIQDAGLDHEEFDHILIDSFRMPYVSDALKILGIDRSKVIETVTHPFISADELTFVTLGCLLPPDPWVLRWLREKFLPNEPRQVAENKIFISRAGALRRRLHAEEYLTHRLQTEGFKAIALETLSFQEQIALMASAKVVVASHGAGLTNLVWCSPGAKVAEFFAAEYINVCYWNIANMLDLKYSYAIGNRTLSDVEDGPAIMNMRRLESDLVFPDPGMLFERIMDFVSNQEP